MKKALAILLLFATLAGIGMGCGGPKRGTKTDIDKPLPQKDKEAP